MKASYRRSFSGGTFAVFAALLTCLLAAGCDLCGPGPEEVLSQYLDSFIQGRYEETYSFLSEKDRAAKSFEEYLAENPDRDNLLAQAASSKTSYTILEVSVRRNHASADVKITSPDFLSVFADVMGAAVRSAFGDEDLHFRQFLSEKIRNFEVPLRTERTTFQLVKEGGEWKVFLNWAAQNIIRERRARIRALREEAENSGIVGSLPGAVGEFERALGLDPALAEWNACSDEPTKTRDELKRQQEYIRFVKVYGLKAAYLTTDADLRVPGVQFKLQNTGDRTLDEVEVTVYFKDNSGTAIWEESFLPVQVSAFSPAAKPLKPNYIWQMERDSFFEAPSVPSEWEEGAVSAKVAGIRFAAETGP